MMVLPRRMAGTDLPSKCDLRLLTRHSRVLDRMSGHEGRGQREADGVGLALGRWDRLNASDVGSSTTTPSRFSGCNICPGCPTSTSVFARRLTSCQTP